MSCRFSRKGVEISEKIIGLLSVKIIRQLSKLIESIIRDIIVTHLVKHKLITESRSTAFVEADHVQLTY